MSVSDLRTVGVDRGPDEEPGFIADGPSQALPAPHQEHRGEAAWHLISDHSELGR